MIARELYAILGVPHTASQDDIQQAYRRRSRECHPDAPGGSREAWERLSEAHRVLSSPELRDQYDRTGVAGEAPRYEPEIDPRVLIVMGEVVRNVAALQETLDGQDVVELILRNLEGIRVSIAARVAEGERVLRRLETLQKRKKRRRRRGRSARNDVLSLVLAGQIEQTTRAVEDFRQQLWVHDEVTRVFEQYDYTWEMPLPPPMSTFRWGLGRIG